MRKSHIGGLMRKSHFGGLLSKIGFPFVLWFAAFCTKYSQELQSKLCPATRSATHSIPGVHMVLRFSRWRCSHIFNNIKIETKTLIGQWWKCLEERTFLRGFSQVEDLRKKEKYRMEEIFAVYVCFYCPTIQMLSANFSDLYLVSCLSLIDALWQSSVFVAVHWSCVRQMDKMKIKMMTSPSCETVSQNLT